MGQMAAMQVKWNSGWWDSGDVRNNSLAEGVRLVLLSLKNPAGSHNHV